MGDVTIGAGANDVNVIQLQNADQVAIAVPISVSIEKVDFNPMLNNGIIGDGNAGGNIDNSVVNPPAAGDGG